MGRREALASRAADTVIRDSGISALPVDPIGIARAEGIDVVAKPAGTRGVSGMLIRDGDDFIISYATHIENEGFKRFAISHELGHYFLPGHPEAVLGPDGVHHSKAGFSSGNRYEREADHFAAGLLMPRSLVVPELARAGTGLDAVETLKHRCGTSLTASAIRYADLCDDPVAVIVSEGPRISYCFMSEMIADAPDIQWIKKGEPVPAGTITSTLSTSPERVAACERLHGTTGLREWFGSGPDLEVDEDVIGLGSYGKTLTVLTAQDWPDEDEDDEPDDDEPRFRRSRRR